MGCRRVFLVLALVMFTALFLYGKLFAYGEQLAVEDGFTAAGKIPGEHLVILYESGVNIPLLLMQLDITFSDRLLAGKAAQANLSVEQELSDSLDTLFIRVCDILDIRLYTFEGNIKVCQDSAQLAKVYSVLFGRELKNASSFYVHSLNTIYVTAQSFKSVVVAHEIAHAVISNYFVVLPSIKIQEILSGYVEYQLRKTEVSPVSKK